MSDDRRLACSAHPFFLDVESGALGRRFAVYHPPLAEQPLGLVVYVHPFAEEMNRSRRMAALQSRALARAGFAVVQVDLIGCGDSAGDFGDATWAQWIADVARASTWLLQRHGGLESDAPPLWHWGLRAGCLIAVQAAKQLSRPCHFLFWQPTPSGKSTLQQFLRLELAGNLAGQRSKGRMTEMRAQLAGGGALEVAGYTLGAALAKGLEEADLRPPDHLPGGRVEWIEIASRSEGALAPASVGYIDDWAQAGWFVNAQVVQGPSFWQTSEIEVVPELPDATVNALKRVDGATATGNAYRTAVQARSKR